VEDLLKICPWVASRVVTVESVGRDGRGQLGSYCAQASRMHQNTVRLPLQISVATVVDSVESVGWDVFTVESVGRDGRS